MPNLHPLETEGQRTDGEIRLLALPVRTTLDFQLPSTLLPEAPASDSGSAGGSRKVVKQMKTQILIEIDHTLPLPSKTPITDVIAQRVYGYLYANGVEAGVAAKLWDVTEEKQ
jgi:hypothetical protein